MKHTIHQLRRAALPAIAYLAISAFSIFTSNAQETCATAVPLTVTVTCSNTSGNLRGANATAGLTTSCGNNASPDHWYSFVPATPYPTIRLSNMGTQMDNSPTLSLYTGTCPSVSYVACTGGSAATTVTMTTSTTPGGSGLIPGQTYYIRVHTNGTSTSSGATADWAYRICVTEPLNSRIETSRSYINITKGSTGGTVSVGDTLEMRATFVLFDAVAGTYSAGSADSLAFYDTLRSGAGLALIPGTIALRTNEGLVYRTNIGPKVPFTDAFDTDQGWYTPLGSDTAIRINIGANSSNVARGRLDNTSRPSVFGATCIIMATYRVRVYAPFNSKICYKSGAFSYRDRNSSWLKTASFKRDSLVVYNSPGLCPNSVSPTNAIGVESNGTFGWPLTGIPLAKNRGTTLYTPTYLYKPFAPGQGPDDYYYAIANNTSTTTTINNALLKPDATNRLFSLWDITGDHTGATDPIKGNKPCDTTKVRSATNPCGYMLVINSAYKTDTAFQYTATNLCPNTYYEIAGWFKNVCSKCSGDSLGNGSGETDYQAATPGDTTGVKPNIAFDVDGTDYYTTGNIIYQGTLSGIGAQRASDSTNKWVKRGFTYLTGPAQTSFQLTLRNNAPGGGGNDWVMDDIAIQTCLPRMTFYPTLNPSMCRGTSIHIIDTVRSYFNNYTHFKWQRSTDGGTTWVDLPGTTGTATPALVNGVYQYQTGFVVTPANSQMINNGDKYRVIVATTAANLSNTNCQVTDGTSVVTVNVINCGIPLKTDLLSFSATETNGTGHLTWTTSREEEQFTFYIEKSTDGANYQTVATVNGRNNPRVELNTYKFDDPAQLTGPTHYRIYMMNRAGEKKYTRTILLTPGNATNFAMLSVVNPFSDHINFEVSMPEEGRIDAALIDLNGATVRRSNHIATKGQNNLTMQQTEHLPAGMYVFQLSYNGEVISRKLIKKN